MEIPTSSIQTGSSPICLESLKVAADFLVHNGQQKAWSILFARMDFVDQSVSSSRPCTSRRSRLSHPPLPVPSATHPQTRTTKHSWFNSGSNTASTSYLPRRLDAAISTILITQGWPPLPPGPSTSTSAVDPKADLDHIALREP